jgi:hypothetical protein
MEDNNFENYLKKLVTGKKDGGRMGYGFGSLLRLLILLNHLKVKQYNH